MPVTPLEPAFSPEFLASILAAVPAHVTRIDPDGTIRYINLVHLGSEAGESLLGESVYTFLLPEYHEAARACFEEVMATREPGRYGSRATAPDGTLADFESHVAPIVQAGDVVGLCIVGVDVTEDRARERALREAEAHASFVVEATRMGIWHHDLRTDTPTWSERLYEITQAAPGDSFLERLHPHDRARMQEGIDRLVREGWAELHLQLIMPDGSSRWVRCFGATQYGGDGEPVAIAGGMLDVTEQHEVREQLYRAQRFDAVGQMTAGVAHNFNNLLMALVPGLDLLEEHVDAEGLEHLGAAREVAERATGLVRQLMTFAQTRPTDEQTKLAETVMGTIRLARRTFDPRIRIDLRVDGDAEVRCAKEDVDQIVMNLLLNARDAMLDASTVEPAIAVRVDVPPGQTVGRVRVADNGPGVAEGDRERLFEPFFTTKGQDGTGLGLAASFAVAQRVGGALTLVRADGPGATFELVVPLGQDVAAASEDASDADSAEAQIRVLVVDDEAMVRRVTVRALARSGIATAEASSVSEARALLARDTRFHVALVDRHLTDAPGRELVPTLRATCPDAAVVFLTGTLVSDVEAALVDGVLTKPLTLAELVDGVLGFVGPRSA